MIDYDIQIDSSDFTINLPSGIEWKEFHAGLARAMQYYASEFKTERLFNMGLWALDKIEKETTFARVYNNLPMEYEKK